MTLFNHTNVTYSLAALKNNYLASGSLDTTIKIWNIINGSLIKTLEGHSLEARSLAVCTCTCS